MQKSLNVFDSINTRLASFIQQSPSPFHAAEKISERLQENSFSFLGEQDPWKLEPGKGYFTTRNGSAVVAFKLPYEIDPDTPISFQIAATHTDSPSFKVKHVPILKGSEGYLTLNVEGYGGMIDSTWLDRPLTLAGRVLVRTASGVESRLVHFDRDLLLIPNLAIHMNHQVNKGVQLNHQIDLRPLLSAGELGEESFPQLVAQQAGARPEDVLSSELFLVNRQKPTTWGAEGEFFSAPKLDNLQGTFACLEAFVARENESAIIVLACFDNEEVGSNTKQGAMGTLLKDTLRRCCIALGAGEEGFLRAQASSFLVSCDNAHALHPNHPEKADERNRPLLNKGIVVKESSNQKYTTDAFSRAVFEGICTKAGIPFQAFANRSDSAGGSTLGNLSNIQMSMHAVDVGMPQLAMHSSFETTGALDTLLGIRALAAFYSANLKIHGSQSASF